MATAVRFRKIGDPQKTYRNQGRLFSIGSASIAVPKQLKLIWLACGNKDGLIRISQAVHGYLKENGVPHIWHVDGNAHDTTEWDNNLYLFSQRIFK
jgi:hypothetical protein